MSGVTSARSGNRRPIQWSAPARASSPIRNILRAAIEHIRADLPDWLLRRGARRTFILWASDIPIRYTDINGAPIIVIRLIWLVQVVLLLDRRGRHRDVAAAAPAVPKRR